MPAANSTGSRPVVIVIRGLRKRLGGREVLRGVDLDVYSGTTTTILGVSGCGKTTLLKHIIGLLKPDAGEVQVHGADIAALGRRELFAVRQRIGMVFQSAALLQSLSVLENVGLPLYENTRLRVPEIERVAREKLRLVRLAGYEYYYPASLSGGMKKRAGVARAIVTNPDIILYDEPTTGLDPVITSTVNELIVDMQRKLGVTSVVISHDVQSARRISDYIAILHEGRIFASGTPDAVMASEDAVVRQFLEGRTEGPISESLWGASRVEE